MAARFSRPRLIDDQDERYRAFVTEITIGRKNQHAIRPPTARDLFGGEAEEALRGWLADRVALADTRILEYYEHRGRQAFRKYRELDALCLSDPRMPHVFEFKASRKATSLRRALSQLRDTREILRLIFASVRTTILLVDTGIPHTAEEARLQLEQDLARRAASAERQGKPFRVESPDPPPTLDEVLATLPQVQLAESLDDLPDNPDIIGVLCFRVEQIIALAGEENLHLEWDSDEEFDEPEPPQLQRYSFGADTEEEDESPLAAALRKAGMGKDEG